MVDNQIIIRKMSSCCFFSGFCVLIVLAQIVRRVLPWFYENLIGPKFMGPKVDLKKMGDWAVVTGATDGIGKAYAKGLAKKGLNLVLISRSLEKLEKVSKEIGDISDVIIKVIDIDFTQGPEIYEKINENIQDLEIGVLVNNVGISYPHPEFFLDTVEENENLLRDIVTCNIHSVTHMCKLILPQMVERKKGVIINISSMAAKIPNPLLSIYSGTKAFVDKFSEDLNTEYNPRGIIIQSVLPGFVVSNMSKIKKPTLLAPSADCYVSSALRTLGFATHTTGYFPHAIMKLTIDIIATIATDSVANSYVFKQLLSTRNRALRSKAKKAK